MVAAWPEAKKTVWAPHGVEGFTTGEGDRTPADRGQDTEYQQTHPGGGRHLCGFHTHREVGGITVDQVVICPGLVLFKGHEVPSFLYEAGNAAEIAGNCGEPHPRTVHGWPWCGSGGKL